MCIKLPHKPIKYTQTVTKVKLSTSDFYLFEVPVDVDEVEREEVILGSDQ